MKNPDSMTDKQIVHWLNKTSDSLASFAAKGNGPNSARGYELRDRWDDLKDFLIHNHKIDLWIDWCDSRGYHEKSNSFDFFA